MEKKTIPERVNEYLKKQNCVIRKAKIMKELKLSKSAVDRACRILRKKKLAGYYRTGSNFTKRTNPLKIWVGAINEADRVFDEAEKASEE